MNKPIGSFHGRPIVAERAGLTITRVGAHIGAEITGIDVRKPMSDEVRDAIEDALADNGLLIFRNQDISSQNLIDFGSRTVDKKQDLQRFFNAKAEAVITNVPEYALKLKKSD